MGSCGESAILDDPKDMPVIEQHLCSVFPVELVSVQEPCSKEACSVFDSNVDLSGIADGCMEEGHVDSTSFVDVTEGSRDDLGNECENADVLRLEKTAEDDCQSSLGICCGDTEVSCLESGGLCSEGKFQDEDNFDLPSEPITADDLQKNFAQQGEQKDDKSHIIPSAGDDSVVVEGKNDDAELLAGDFNSVHEFGHSEMTLESDSMADLLVGCYQENEPEVIMINVDTLSKVAESSDALDWTEANACMKISPSLGMAVPSGALYTEEEEDTKVESTSDKLHDQKDCDSTSEEKIRAVVDNEITINLYAQASSSPDSHRALDSSPVVDSMCEPTLLDPGNEPKNAILQIEENLCNLKDCSTEGTPNSSIRKPLYPESGQPLTTLITNSPSEGVPYLLAKGDSVSINNNCSVDIPVQTTDDQKETVEVVGIPDGILLPTQRSSRRTNLGRKTQTKKASRKSKSKASVTDLGWGMNINLEAARKRSCLSKPARSSVWGLVGNVEQFFQQENGLEAHEAMYQEVGKAKSKHQSEKLVKNGASSSSLSSVQKHSVSASTTRVRLKIKFRKEIDLSCSNALIPESVDGLASSCLGSNSGSQKVGGNAGDKVAFSKLESSKNDPDKDSVVLNGQIINSQLENAKETEKLDGDAEEPCHAVPPERVVEGLVKPIDNMVIDPGTSPDSEVINSIPEVQAGERQDRHEDDLHHAVLGSSKEFNSSLNVTTSKKEKKKDKLICSGNCIAEDGSQGIPRNNRAKHSKNRRHKKNCNDVISSLELPTSTEVSKSVGSKELSAEARSLSGEIEFGGSTEALKVKSHMEVKTPCKPPVDHEFSEIQDSENLLPSTRPLGRKLPKSLTPIKVSKAKSKAPDSASMEKTTTGRKEKQKRPINKSGVKAKGDSLKVTCEVDDHPHPDVVGNHWSDAVGTISTSDNRVSVDVSNLDMLPGVGLGEQHQSPRNAWVSCDDCHKWRRIPARLADLIDETKCTWTCKDSSDTAFADCAIPQEKSNAEINAELGISDASGEEDACESSKNYKQLEYRLPMVSQKSTFTHILTNEYLHRSQKTQTIDEIMVCHCKSPPEGKLGCRDECLNRMLNIECVQGTCPCGDRCANQQFQKHKYSSLKWFKCGKKGYGLKALERVAKGQFIIEYVGEVLDMHAYEARQKEYALKGHRHFYFMTLNGSEVIDASAKGNLGRFINHSCDPNCRTEKWMVNGEICIGLFALRDIQQDEELTFDYNYVRVFGAAAKQCYCGSPLCRGYIGGGDPLKAELIVQGDSDEEFPEPVMITEGGKIEDNISTPKYFDNVDTKPSRHSLKDRDVLDKSTTAIDADGSSEKESSMNPTSAVSLLHSSVEVEDSKGKLPSSDRVEDITSNPMPSVQQEYAVESESAEKSSSIPRLEVTSFLTTVSQVLSNSTDGDREFKSEMVEGRNGCSQSHLLVKNPKLNGSVKKGKVRAKSANGVTSEVTAFQLPVSSIKQKKVGEASPNGRFEAVQGKLNELLDVNGGISKRKDATKGYLKLLLLTVASGDRSNGEAIQSNRDLSMILGALLKTKSRAVLNDIINKNGLQMLHKILKQYRQDFKKIPILRKLLKVLEYLAEGKILTPEHINSSPPCRGMESFRESVLSLTEHDDKQVHQIARSFRDRWIPRFLRKNGYMDRDDSRAESHRSFNGNRFAASHNHMHEQDLRPSEAIDCAQQSMLVTTIVDAGAQEGCSRVSLDGVEIKGARKRKRKSRWDQPAETNSYSDAVISSTDESQKIHEDIPPGFSCPLRSANTAINSGDPALQVAGPSGYHLAIGHPKEKYNSRLPVSYGMPLSVSQQYGTPHAEITGCWVIAPGMAFNPFPPLPPYPRDNKDRQLSNTDAMTIDQPAEPSNTDAMTIDQSAEPSNTDAMTIDQPAEVKQWDTSDPVNCCSDDMIPTTTGANSEEMNSQCEDNKHEAKRLKGDSTDLGAMYFRQQKWNNSKIHRPWFRRNGWKGIGNNSSGDMHNIDVPGVKSCSSEDAISRDEKEI